MIKSRERGRGEAEGKQLNCKQCTRNTRHNYSEQQIQSCCVGYTSVPPSHVCDFFSLPEHDITESGALKLSIAARKRRTVA
jgi:hypothetical protein